MIKTSVVIPVYNTKPYLEMCIDSIFAQTQKEIEVIVINDGSTDGSLNELHRIAEKYPKLIVIDQKNQGLSCTRNNGMKLAKGKYVFFCDSDDMLDDIHALEECYESAERQNLDFAMFDAKIYGEIHGIPVNPYDRSRIIERPYQPMSGEQFIRDYFGKAYCPSACLVYIRLDFLKDNHISFLPHVYYEDNLFYCRISLTARRVLYIPKEFYKRLCRMESITRSSFDRIHMQSMLIIAKEIDSLECNGILKSILHEKAMDILRNAFDSADRNHLFESENAVNVIYEAAKNLCDAKHYRDSDLLYRISLLYGEENAGINRMREDNLKRIFEKLKLGNEQVTIGIYGTGKYAKRLLDEYENRFGRIRAEVIFIESERRARGDLFRGREVYGVREIGELNLEFILVASSIYEQNICRTIESLYRNRFAILKLYSDLHF